MFVSACAHALAHSLANCCCCCCIDIHLPFRISFIRCAIVVRVFSHSYSISISSRSIADVCIDFCIILFCGLLWKRRCCICALHCCVSFFFIWSSSSSSSSFFIRFHWKYMIIIAFLVMSWMCVCICDRFLHYILLWRPAFPLSTMHTAQCFALL